MKTLRVVIFLLFGGLVMLLISTPGRKATPSEVRADMKTAWQAAETYRFTHDGNYPPFDTLQQLVRHSITIPLCPADSTPTALSVSYWSCPDTRKWGKMVARGAHGEALDSVDNFPKQPKSGTSG